MQVPRLLKIVVNMGVGDVTQDGKLIDAAVEDLRIITGQQPKVNRARKSIANFKLREGQADRRLSDAAWAIGCGSSSTGWFRLPFPGSETSVGSARRVSTVEATTASVSTEQLIFPEIDYDKMVKVRGMDITFVTTAATDEQGKALLDAFGFPFRQQAGV